MHTISADFLGGLYIGVKIVSILCIAVVAYLIYQVIYKNK